MVCDAAMVRGGRGREVVQRTENDSGIDSCKDP